MKLTHAGLLVDRHLHPSIREANINSGGNLIGNLETDIIPAYSIQVDVTEDKALTIDASGKITALWGLDANKYYAGSAMYFAKNKL